MEECLLINIFPTGCPHEQGGRGSAKCRQQQTGGGGSKITKTSISKKHPLWMAPNIEHGNVEHRTIEH